MLKFILLAALVLWLFYSPGVRKLLRSLRSTDTPAKSQPGPPPPHRPAVMVPCAHCGVHLPDRDALTNEAGELFCSEAHRRAGSRPA